MLFRFIVCKLLRAKYTRLFVKQVIELKGQWQGKICGTNKGDVFVNFDDDLPNIAAVYLYDQEPYAHYVFAGEFQTSSNTITIKLSDRQLLSKADASFVDPGNIYCEAIFESPDEITGSWSTDVGTSGILTLSKVGTVNIPAAAKQMSWNEFKNYVLTKLEPSEDFVFRGQSDSEFKLISLFHRLGRNNLLRYELDDIRELHKAVAAELDVKFNLSDPIDFAELVYIGQHFGFPTPFLDWTLSPFVAAFFAFEGAKPKQRTNQSVRVFIFNRKLWERYRLNYIGNIHDAKIGVRLMDVVSRFNKRSTGQQALAMFTNVSDTMLFINEKSVEYGQTFLEIIDIPVSERNIAMKELQLMGITHRSIYPGLEGACKALREQKFVES